MFEGQGLTVIALAVGFVLAAITLGRSLFKRTLFPKVALRDYLIGVVAGTAVIFLLVNVPFLGILSGAGLILFLVLPRFLKIKPIRF